MVKNELLYGLLASFIIVASDLALFGTNTATLVASLGVVLAPFAISGAVAVNIGIPIVAGILVFAVEFLERKDFATALVLGLVAGFIILIPTPIAGIFVGTFSSAKKLKLIK